jgi:phospholipase C
LEEPVHEQDQVSTTDPDSTHACCSPNPVHVAPPIINSFEYGFRVPLIVVSPYANQGYVSHVTHDFGSILKFIEETFRLPSLGYADALADDLSDCFNFKERSRFQKISAPHNAKYFVNDKSPATDPDND